MPVFPRDEPPFLSSGSEEHIRAAQLVTGLTQCFFQGILLAQLAIYLSSPSVSRQARDVRETRLVIACVIFVSLLALAQTVRYVYLAYIVSVIRQDIFSVPSRWLDPLLTALTSDLAKAFFIYRTYRSIRSLLLLILLCVIQALISAAQIWTVIGIYAHPEVRYITKGNTPFNISAISSLVFDLILATILCYGLFKSRTGIRYLDRFITHIMLSFWTCAIPPAFVMIPAVVLYNVVTSTPGSAWTAFWLATSGKLYCHALLRSINSREHFRDRLSRAREAINEEYQTNSLRQPFTDNTSVPTETAFSRRHSNQYDDPYQERRVSVVKSIMKHSEAPRLSDETQHFSHNTSEAKPYTPEARARLNSIITALESPKVEEWRSNV